MFDIDRIQIGAAKGAGLSPRGGHKFSGRDGNGSDAQTFEFADVVQTARGAGTSIGKRFDHRLALAQFLNQALRRGLGKRRLHQAKHSADLKTLFQKTFQMVLKEAAAGFADVQQTNRFTRQRSKSRRSLRLHSRPFIKWIHENGWHKNPFLNFRFSLSVKLRTGHLSGHREGSEPEEIQRFCKPESAIG
jgi:hypothetical protein